MPDKTIIQIAIPNEILTRFYKSCYATESIETIILNQLRVLIVKREDQKIKQDKGKRA